MKNETQLLMSYEWKPSPPRPRPSFASELIISAAAAVLSILNLIIK